MAMALSLSCRVEACRVGSDRSDLALLIFLQEGFILHKLVLEFFKADNRVTSSNRYCNFSVLRANAIQGVKDKVWSWYWGANKGEFFCKIAHVTEIFSHGLGPLLNSGKLSGESHDSGGGGIGIAFGKTLPPIS